MNEAAPVISVTDIRKTYRSGLIRRKRVDALRGVTLEVPRGRIYGLLGPNGAGKTTLIKILLGIVRKSSGDASVLGRVAGSLQSRRQIGYLPENHRIPGHLTGNSALEYYGSLSGLPMSQIKQRRPEMLDLVGLAEWGKHSVSGYSKGMLQRLGLAQAMLHKPELIILDEPTDGVDPVGRKEIRDVLKRLAAEGHSIFLNSHLLQEIELVCDSVAILDHGQLRRSGSVAELTRALDDAPVEMRLVAEVEQAKTLLEDVQVHALEAASETIVRAELKLPDQAQLDATVDRLRAAGVSIESITRRKSTLEEAFLQIVEQSES